jgi:hypothetical protein
MPPESERLRLTRDWLMRAELEEIVEAALQTKPLTPGEKKALEEEYRRRERAKPGRKKRGD